MRDSGAAHGDLPGPDETARATDTAVAHVAGSACDMVILPIEDALALTEQPNLPGTRDEHPNWRRRLDGPASALLDPPQVGARLAAVQNARTVA